jgi:hypothetical protein
VCLSCSLITSGLGGKRWEWLSELNSEGVALQTPATVTHSGSMRLVLLQPAEAWEQMWWTLAA